jgi:hypothetical protein
MKKIKNKKFIKVLAINFKKLQLQTVAAKLFLQHLIF